MEPAGLHPPNRADRPCGLFFPASWPSVAASFFSLPFATFSVEEVFSSGVALVFVLEATFGFSAAVVFGFVDSFIVPVSAPKGVAARMRNARKAFI